MKVMCPPRSRPIFRKAGRAWTHRVRVSMTWGTRSTSVGRLELRRRRAPSGEFSRQTTSAFLVRLQSRQPRGPKASSAQTIAPAQVVPPHPAPNNARPHLRGRLPLVTLAISALCVAVTSGVVALATTRSPISVNDAHELVDWHGEELQCASSDIFVDSVTDVERRASLGVSTEVLEAPATAAPEAPATAAPEPTAAPEDPAAEEAGDLVMEADPTHLNVSNSSVAARPAIVAAASNKTGPTLRDRQTGRVVKVASIDSTVLDGDSTHPGDSQAPSNLFEAMYGVSCRMPQLVGTLARGVLCTVTLFVHAAVAGRGSSRWEGLSMAFQLMLALQGCTWMVPMVEASSLPSSPFPPFPPPPPPSPSPPPPPPSPLPPIGCRESCTYSSDNDCDDGGPGSEFSGHCSLGTDCIDCGPRTESPPPSPFPSSPPPPPPSPSPTHTPHAHDTLAGNSRDAVMSDGPRRRLQGARCIESCNYAFDGDCDDTGPGAEYDVCQLGTDCTDCGPRVMPPPTHHPDTPYLSTSPPPPDSIPSCAEACHYSSDGDCDDGGMGAEYNSCSCGTDCFDCGPRELSMSSTDTCSGAISSPLLLPSPSPPTLPADAPRPPPPPPGQPPNTAPYHVATITLNASGDPSDYDQARVADLEAKFATMAQVHPSAVHATVEAASVRFTVQVRFPSEWDAQAGAFGMQSALGDASTASTQLGITVESSPQVEVVIMYDYYSPTPPVPPSLPHSPPTHCELTCTEQMCQILDPPVPDLSPPNHVRQPAVCDRVDPIKHWSDVSMCAYANDGICDDGGPGSTFDECRYGYDCEVRLRTCPRRHADHHAR